MSITYRVIERGEPGVAGGGTKQFYPIAKVRSRISLHGLSKQISRMSSLSRPDVLAVLEALTVLVPEHLLMGRLVELGNLCTLRIGLNAGPSATAEEVGSSNVKRVRTLFNPARELRDALKSASFEKVG